MKYLVIGLAVLVLAAGGAGGAWYLGMFGGPPKAAPRAAAPRKPQVEVKPLTDDDLHEFITSSIEKRSGRTLIKTEEVKSKPKEFDKFDYEDPKDRMKARGQVLDEINEERDQSLKELYLSDREAPEKKARGDAVTRWLQRNPD